MPPRGYQSRGGRLHGGQTRAFFRTQRQQTADIVWGSTLALGLPVVCFVLVSALNPGGLDEKFQGGSFGLKKETPPPPMTRELGEEILREIKRLYEVNYAQIFLQRFNRDDLDSEDRLLWLSCAKLVIGHCRLTLLKRLKDELGEPGTRIEPLRAAIDNWERVLADAGRHLEDIDPRPEALRPPPVSGTG